MYKMMTIEIYSGLPWWLRWQRICLRCRRPRFDPWIGKMPWRRERKPPPVFLPTESPRTEEPGGLQSMGLQRVGHDQVTKNTHKHTHTHTHTHTHILWSSGPQPFMALGTDFVEDNISTDQGRKCFQDNSSSLHLLCTLFLLLLYQVNFRLSSIKFWRLGTLLCSIFRS